MLGNAPFILLYDCVPMVSYVKIDEVNSSNAEDKWLLSSTG